MTDAGNWFFPARDPCITSKFPVKLPVAHVDTEDFGSPMLKQAITEAACGSISTSRPVASTSKFLRAPSSFKPHDML